MSSKTRKIYKGDIEIQFREKGHKYVLSHRDDPPIGCTAVLNIVDKSGPLMGWALNEMADYLKKNLDENIITDGGIDEIEKKKLIRNAKKARYKTKDDAIDYGNEAHEWCEKYIKSHISDNEDMPPMPNNEIVKKLVKQFLAFVDNHDIKWIASERLCYSKRLHVPGTVDYIAEVDGKLEIGDFKTSKYIYPTHVLQTAGYQIMLEEEEKYKNENYKKYKYDQRRIVHLDKNGDEYNDLVLADSSDHSDHMKAYEYALGLLKTINSIKKINKVYG